MPDNSVTIADVYFPSRILNAGGTVHLPEDLERVLFLPDGSPSGVGGCVIGSVVKQQRDGNQGTTYCSNAGECLEGDIDSHNSKGLWGRGWYEFYELMLPQMIQRIKSSGMPAIVNEAAFDTGEAVFLVERSFAAGADIVTQNWSCGNTGGDVLAYEESFYRPTLEATRKVVPPGKKMWLKMPYFPSRGMLRRMAEFINPCEEVGGVVLINTLANGLRLDPTGEPYITPFGGLAGVGGAAIRDLALGQCRMWRDELNTLRSDKAVIGVGGIQTREHARMFLDFVGIDLIKVHTAYREQGAGIFKKLAGIL